MSHSLEAQTKDITLIEVEKLRNISSTSSISIPDKNNAHLVKKYAFIICREYLGGQWKGIDFDDLFVERISGGLSNYLYKCEINRERFQMSDSEPSKILLRLYGENHNSNSLISLKDVMVSAMLSDFKLGPKLYGFFPLGRLEQFVEAPCLDQNDMYIPKVSASIAVALAKFHTLEMPFSKEPRWLFETTVKYLKQVSNIKFTNQKDIKKFNLLKSFNLENEFDQLRNFLERLDSQVVFCHNDINIGNILKLPHKLMIIDYEYGSYNYRGFDFGNHFCEWMFNNNYKEYPFFQYDYSLYPSREQQIHFAKAYMKGLKEEKEKLRRKAQHNLSVRIENLEIDKNNNKNEHDSEENIEDLEQLLKEANYFALSSHLFWIFWAMCQASTCKIKFEYLDYALARCDAYFKQKKILFPEGFSVTIS